MALPIVRVQEHCKVLPSGDGTPGSVNTMVEPGTPFGNANSVNSPWTSRSQSRTFTMHSNSIVVSSFSHKSNSSSSSADKAAFGRTKTQVDFAVHELAILKEYARLPDDYCGGQAEVFNARFFPDPVFSQTPEEKPPPFLKIDTVECCPPDGWIYLPVQPPTFSKHEDVKDWLVAYHGTSITAVKSILDEGLKKPGEIIRTKSDNRTVLKALHGIVGATSAVYLTPSLWCAALPSYAHFAKIEDHEEENTSSYLQVVCRVRVKPGKYIVQNNTLLPTDWDPRLRIDPHIRDNTSMEWVVLDPKDVIFDGVLLRHLTADVGSGCLVRRFGSVCCGPGTGLPQNAEEAEMTYKDRLERALRERGRIVETIGRLEYPQVNTCIWTIPAAEVLKLKPRQQLLSQAFELEGSAPNKVRGLAIAFWPRGDCGRDPENHIQDEICSVYVESDRQDDVISMSIAIGDVHREFVHRFGGVQKQKDGSFTGHNYGFPRFGTLNIGDDVSIKVCLIAHGPCYAKPCAGQIKSQWGSATWTIPAADVLNSRVRHRLWSEPFRLGSVDKLVLLFFPYGDGDGNVGSSCSLYIVVPHRGLHTFQLTMLDTMKLLSHKFTSEFGAGWGWCYGFPDFCSSSRLATLQDDVTIVVTLTDSPKGSCCSVS